MKSTLLISGLLLALGCTTPAPRPGETPELPPHLADPQPVRAFAESMVMPMSVLPHANGAYVAQGPEIFFLDDENGDNKADRKDVLLHGFGGIRVFAGLLSPGRSCQTQGREA